MNSTKRNTLITLLVLASVPLIETIMTPKPSIKIEWTQPQPSYSNMRTLKGFNLYCKKIEDKHYNYIKHFQLDETCKRTGYVYECESYVEDISRDDFAYSCIMSNVEKDNREIGFSEPYSHEEESQGLLQLGPEIKSIKDSEQALSIEWEQFNYSGIMPIKGFNLYCRKNDETNYSFIDYFQQDESCESSIGNVDKCQNEIKSISPDDQLHGCIMSNILEDGREQVFSERYSKTEKEEEAFEESLSDIIHKSISR